MSSGSSILLAWSPDPLILLPLLAGGALYAMGWRRLRRSGREQPFLPTWRAWCFAGGLLVIVLALLSPIDALADQLFWAHMVEHLLLILVAAPLLLFGAPLLPILWGIPSGDRRAVARLFLVRRSPIHRVFTWLTQPLVSGVLFIVTIGYWHIPVFYDAAQGRTLIHDLEHLMFFVTALLYWWPVIHPTGGKRRLGYGLAIFYLLPPSIEGALVGAFLTFAPTPIYATYRHVGTLFGLTGQEDQQLGGLIMWIPGGLVYLAGVFTCLAMFFKQEEQKAQQYTPVVAPR